MSNTINVPVDNTNTWLTVITASSSMTGVFSVTSSSNYCCYNGEPPEDLIGHRSSGDIIPFSLESGESLCVKTDRQNVTVVVTED